MGIEIERAQERHRREWNDFVRSNPDSHFYQLYRWRDVLKAAYGYRTQYLIARTRGQVAGVLPLFEVRSVWGRYLSSLPGGICSRDGTSALALLDEAVRLKREMGLPSLQIRELPAELPTDVVITRRVETAYIAALPSDSGQMWSAVKANARTPVRKARKLGVRVHWGSRHLGEFYSVYAGNMRDLGTPAIPKAFFVAAIAALSDEVSVAVATHSGRVIGGLLMGALPPTRAFLLFAASRRRDSALCSSDLLYWHALETFADRGYTSFDMGRSVPDSGVAWFKQKWKGVPKPLYYQFESGGRSGAVEDPRRDRRYLLLTRLWRRLPISVATRLSPLIRRYIPLG